MKIIDAPWLAIDIGSDRTHVAFQESDHEMLSVETMENEFSTVFHVSKNNHIITLGRAALEHLETDPEGIVLLDVGQLMTDEAISLPEDRGEVRPTHLFTEMLRHVRKHGETHLFNGEPVRACALAVPRRSDKFRRAYRQIAVQAGFQQVLFRDALLSAGVTWRHIWGGECRHLIVCNLAASLVSFSLLRSRFGGFERLEQVPTRVTLGIDEIDRIILETAYATSNRTDAERFADRLRLKIARRECSFDVEKQFQVRLGGRNSHLYTAHFLKAAQILAGRIQNAFREFQEQCRVTVGEREIPVALVGGGANVPVIFETIDLAAEGKVYWWGGAEEAVAMGTALSLLPPEPKENPSEDEAHFQSLFQTAEAGNVESQYYLGKSLELGHGTAISPEEAFDWLLLSAGNGFSKAKQRLAMLIHSGAGTIHDESEVLRWLRESAVEGFAPAQFQLGVYCLETGKGMEGEALEWVRKAAENAYRPAIEFIEKRFGAAAPPSVVKTDLSENHDDSEKPPDNPSSIFPGKSLRDDHEAATEPTPNEAERKNVPKKTAKDWQDLAVSMGISMLIFFVGAVALGFYRVENPVAEHGSAGLFLCAIGAAVLTAFFAFRTLHVPPRNEAV